VPAPLRDEDGTALAERFENVRISDEVDEKLGFCRLQEGAKREGWLVNMHPVRTRSLDPMQIFINRLPDCNQRS
jgi:DNA polymerase epsilon subunit 1